MSKLTEIPKGGINEMTDDSTNKIDISVVIPLYNELENIPYMYSELISVMESIARPFEIIVVDDGSTDGSFNLLKQIHEQDHHMRVVRLRRNYGNTPAYAAGFDAVRGEWIVTIDADLQNDPADIPAMLATAEEGYDVVNGWRRNRQDALFSRKIPSWAANWLISRVTGVRLHDYGCSLKVLHRDVVKNIKLYGELHRFIPAVASGLGVRVTESTVNHRARERGQSKYSGWWKTTTRTVKVILDLVTVQFLLSFATRPIHIFGTVGLMTSLSGFMIALWLLYVKVAQGEAIGERPLLILATLLIIVGIQFITMGLLSEIMMRTYYESQDKSIYAVREVLDRRSEFEVESPV